MTQSFKTYEFENRTGKDADDLHITWGVNAVEVIGVGGVSPADPDAEFTLEETGGRSTLSDIEVDAGDSIKIRIRCERQTAPPETGITYVWTDGGRPLNRPARLAAAPAEPREEDAATVVFHALDLRLAEVLPRLEALETLAHPAPWMEKG